LDVYDPYLNLQMLSGPLFRLNIMQYRFYKDSRRRQFEGATSGSIYLQFKRSGKHKIVPFSMKASLDPQGAKIGTLSIAV